MTRLSSILPDTKDQPAAAPVKTAFTTMARPIKLKVRPRPEEEASPEQLSPSPKIVEVTVEADSRSHGSSPPKGRRSSGSPQVLAFKLICFPSPSLHSRVERKSSRAFDYNRDDHRLEKSS